ncbi:MAG: hypothetical protein M3R24_41480 [Chloroflexota bacterium]|nr:hypothetical protein [Chloroflexota bacterium]
MKQTAMYLKQEQIRDLRRRALTETERTGKVVTMSDLVREAIDIFLASTLRKADEHAMIGVACAEQTEADPAVTS